jgi:predicted RNA-binding Zn-ribbon protein involved in translation (DUF1610 family)
MMHIMHGHEGGRDTISVAGGVAIPRVLTPLTGGYNMPLLNGGRGTMSEVKYVCPDCGREEAAPGECADCRKALVATCAECGNPVVGERVHGEHIHLK